MTSILSTLRDNLSCSSSELAALPDVLNEHGLILEQLQEDIRAQTEQLEQLQARYDVFLFSDAAHRSLTSPIRRLPSELLSDIMMEAVRPGKHRSRKAFALAHVSCLWRTTALSTPRLWQDIALNAKTSSEYIKFQLELTPPIFPLNVILHKEFYKSGYEALLKQSTRWRSIKLGEMNQEGHNALNELTFPVLEELSFGSRALNDGSLKYQCKPFRHAYSLRKVVVMDFVHALSELNLPWKGLTSLSFFRMEVPYCFAVLEACPSLIQFHLDHCSGTLVTRSCIISLPDLRDFRVGLSLNSIASSSHIFSYLWMPKLNKVELSTSVLPIEALSAISQTSLNVRRVALNFCRCMTGDILDSFQGYSQLEELAVDCSGWESARFTWQGLLPAFALQRDGDGAILPRLRVLELKNVDRFPTKGEVDALIGLITERWIERRSLARLERLNYLIGDPQEADNADFWDPKVLAPLHAMRKAGFGIEVSYRKYEQEFDGYRRYLRGAQAGPFEEVYLVGGM